MLILCNCGGLTKKSNILEPVSFLRISHLNLFFCAISLCNRYLLKKFDTFCVIVLRTSKEIMKKLGVTWKCVHMRTLVLIVALFAARNITIRQ